CATLRDEKWLSKIFFTAKLLNIAPQQRLHALSCIHAVNYFQCFYHPWCGTEILEFIDFHFEWRFWLEP
ncbi:hypothetical protein, partial [Endozoicomonas sp. ONNA2]|uniref:hypothetical protein n=1 Tax=Endozoicomonas sp. ONNA2 TaxID=2828741 RepID=UPI002148FCD2